MENAKNIANVVNKLVGDASSSTEKLNNIAPIVGDFAWPMKTDLGERQCLRATKSQNRLALSEVSLYLYDISRLLVLVRHHATRGTHVDNAPQRAGEGAGAAGALALTPIKETRLGRGGCRRTERTMRGGMRGFHIRCPHRRGGLSWKCGCSKEVA